MEWGIIIVLFVAYWGINKRFDRIEAQREKDREHWDNEMRSVTEKYSDWMQEEFNKVNDTIYTVHDRDTKPEEEDEPYVTR